MRFEMKFAGLSETCRGLLDMEFVHLYKPELKLWRGADRHLQALGRRVGMDGYRFACS